MCRQTTILIIFLLLALMSTGCSETTQALEEQALIASGTIQATEIRIASEFGGRIQLVQVKVGSEIQAGDVLVELDATPWLLQLTPAEAAVNVARAELALVEAGVHPAEIEAARTSLTLAEVQRDGAFIAWQNALKVVNNPQAIDEQIVEARTQVALAAQGVELAEAQLAREQTLRDIREEGSLQRKVADYQVRAAEESLAAAQADEKTVQTLLNQLWAIRNNPLGYIAQANVLEGQYRVAEAGVAVAQARLDDLLDGPTPEEIAVARAAVRQAEAEANVLRLKVERSTLYSPIDGTVIAQAANIGELVAPAATILTLADLHEVTLEVYVSEGRIGQVSLGQRVQVTVDSFPGRAFEGQVIKIGDEPEFTPRNVATAEERLNTFYAVEISLDNSDGVLKPGMPADAQF